MGDGWWVLYRRCNDDGFYANSLHRFLAHDPGTTTDGSLDEATEAALRQYQDLKREACAGTHGPADAPMLVVALDITQLGHLAGAYPRP